MRSLKGILKINCTHDKKINFLKSELLLVFHSYSNLLNCDVTCQEQAFVAGISCSVQSYHIIETQ